MRSTLLRGVVVLGDFAVALGALWPARQVWRWVSAPDPGALQASTTDLLGSNPWMPPGAVLAVAWLVAAAVVGLYEPLRMISSERILRALGRAAVAVLVLAVLIDFYSPEPFHSRALLSAWVLCSALGLMAWRLAFFRLQGLLPAGPGRPVLVVGVGEDAALLHQRLLRDGAQHFAVAGFLRTSASEKQEVAGPVVGSVDDLVDAVNTHRARMVILASRTLDRREAMHVASRCGAMGLPVLQTPFTWGLVSARVEPASVGQLDLVQLGGLAYPGAAQTVKRVFDLVAVLCGGLLLLPFLLAVALLVKLQDGGPVLYASDRVGRGGRSFRFYKFRSMRVGAEGEREDLPNGSDGRLFKMRDDPRVTRLGRLLRAGSIDELPQLINVLRGDMNLVGPRPLPLEDLAGIEGDPEHWYWFEQRSRVKPGITGLWQVAGRSDLPFEAMVDLDVHYIQHWSLLLDLQILARTVPAVLWRRGAR